MHTDHQNQAALVAAGAEKHVAADVGRNLDIVVNNAPPHLA